MYSLVMLQRESRIYFVHVYWREKHSDSYTPLYFSIYPLARLNVPLARYLGQGYFHDYFDDNDAEKEKKVLKIKSIYSAITHVIITPVIKGELMKEFLEEPKGTTYKELLNVAFSICDELLLVKRDQHDLNENDKKFIGEIKPYVK